MKTAYQLYIADIEKIPLMNKVEELAHFRLWKEQGSDAARIAIYRANLRFVVKVAHNYKNQGASILDLIGDGNFGLDSAMRNFDYKTGNKLISYAVWHIRQAMLELLARQSRFISITGAEAVQKSTLDKVAKKLAQKLKREPTEAEIAENLGFTIEKVRHMEMMLKNQASVSLDAKIGGTGKAPAVLRDVIPDINARNPEDVTDMSEFVLKLLKDAKLSVKQINVLTSYYGIKRHPRTLEDIGFDYSHSRERMRQIKEEALKKLLEFQKRAGKLKLPNILEEVF